MLGGGSFGGSLPPPAMADVLERAKVKAQATANFFMINLLILNLKTWLKSHVSIMETKFHLGNFKHEFICIIKTCCAGRFSYPGFRLTDEVLELD